MITLKNQGDIFQRSLELIGKDSFGKVFGPYQYNQFMAWINSIGLPNKYVAEFEQNRPLSNNLRPFFKTLGTPEDPPLSFDSFGRALFPDDYFYFSSASTVRFVADCSSFIKIRSSVEWVDNAVFNYRMGDKLMVPREGYAIATYTTKSVNGIYRPAIQVYPIQTTMPVTYIRIPNDVKFDYDIISETIVYLPPGQHHVNDSVLPIGTLSQSVEPEWPQPAFQDIVEMLVFNYGRNLHSTTELQISKSEMSA